MGLCHVCDAGNPQEIAGSGQESPGGVDEEAGSNTSEEIVNCKIIGRFPKQGFKVKAHVMYLGYLQACLNQGIVPDNVEIDDRWVKEWLEDNRLTQRKPNRKWKVSRPTLKERLRSFWIISYSLRKFEILAKGYDPARQNFDQSPFHMNEAGSKATGTIAMKGCPIIPLIENHAATRERWSLNSVTDSDQARITSGVLPGYEAMFKANGNIKAKRLHEHVDSFGASFKVSVG